MNFTNRELYLLSEGILSLIREAGEAAKRVRSSKIIDEIAAYRSGLRDLNSKLCSMMRDDGENSAAPQTADPNVLIRCYGGMVQEVLSNVDGINCEVFDEDTDEYYEENQRDEWQRLTASGQYHGIY